jgi:hypothetical protein
MPMSPAILILIKAPATEYRMMAWKFGGDEPVLSKAGYSTYDYIAGIILGPNPALLLDRTRGLGTYAVERAGFYHAADLAKAWEWLLNNFDDTVVQSLVKSGNPYETLVIQLEQSKHRDWKIKEVKKEVIVCQ